MRASASPPARFLAVLLLSTACAGSPGGPAGDEPRGPDDPVPGEVGSPSVVDEVRIVVQTSGGIAGMDWQVTLDGESGVIRLDRCRGCPWPTRTSRELTRPEVIAIVEAFLGAGVRAAPEQDFGSCAGCADQFFHAIEFTDQTGRYRVVGDGPSLPPAYEDAMRLVIWEEVPGDPGS